MSAADLIRSFKSFVREEKLFTPGTHLLVAVSGGKDSTVLVHLLRELGYTISLIHCNFHLRGKDSDLDEQFVRDLASRHELKIHVTDIDLSTEALPHESAQMAARRLRYSYFKKILDEYNDYEVTVVTAHQLEDAFETALINFLRGTGLAGLKGIAPKYHTTVRPLLGSSRSEIAAFARERGIVWREDTSNATEAYLRNRVRHQLLPVFDELGLTTTVLARNLRRLRSESSFLTSALTSWAAEVVQRTGEETSVDRSYFDHMSAATTELLLRHATPFAGFTPEQYRQMVTVVGTRQIAGESTLAHVTPTTFRFTPLPAAREVRSVSFTGLPFVYETTEWYYLFEEVQRPEKLNHPEFLYVHPPDFPLHLRPRQRGDRMVPLGMGGKRKKLKKVFQDLELTGFERAEQLLLCTADGVILAILGYCIAEPAKVLPEDEHVLRISWQHKGPEAR
ncbi:tRNA lysidine(34) synthetase TilS [Neolewinella sp.]|uniref:tRNA lysidine(34) synthetase TilS n=1 Tax=Neolewinella sp. TaxID=2993543 RepID=UPI003B5171C1